MPELVSDLRGRQFDAAIFALARREKSRWLAEALANMNVPYRINLEYFDDVDIERSDLFTREGWFFWSAIASARFLLHGLCPLVGQRRTTSQSWLQDRCVTFPVQPTWRQEAKRILAERGIGNHPFVLLTPGGSSSQRWPTRKFAALAVRLAAEFGVHVIVEGGPADGELVERTMQHVAELQRSGRADTRCVAAHNSLGVLAALLERASLLVSNDSAPNSSGRVDRHADALFLPPREVDPFPPEPSLAMGALRSAPESGSEHPGRHSAVDGEPNDRAAPCRARSAP